MAEARQDDDAFVEKHTETVRQLAFRLRGQLDLQGVELDELIGYGFRGLLEARARFDATRGVKFETFAYYRIRGAILDGVRKMAYLPRKVHARRKAAMAQDEVAEQAGEKRLAEASERGGPPGVGAALGAIDDVLGRTCAAFVVAALGQDEDAPRPSPEAQLVGKERSVRVRAALSVLPERERALVEGFYFGDRTLEDIGQELGISKSWASRLHARALGRLREVLGEDL